MRTFLMLVVFVAIAVMAYAVTNQPYPAQPQVETQHPGGIVFSDGTRAIYYDLKTGQETDLTSDMKGAIVQSPIFAASLNGEWLTWGQNGKIWMRQLPKGDPFAIKYRNDDGKWQGNAQQRKTDANLSPGEEYFVWQNGYVNKMLLSPDGNRLSFEAECKKTGWVLKDPGNPQALLAATGGAIPALNGPNTGADHVDFLFKFGHLLPHYSFIDDTYSGIFLLSTVMNENFTRGNQGRAGDLGIYNPAFGNVVYRPNSLIYKTSPEDMQRYTGHPGAVPIMHNDKYPDKTPGVALSWSVKKSAHCLAFPGMDAWNNGKRLAYFIYEVDGKYGPIQIRRVKNNINTHIAQSGTFDLSLLSKFGASWEIPVYLPSCEALAVKPDGSLAVWSKDTIYLVDYLQLEAGMSDKNACKVTKNNTTTEHTLFSVKAETLVTGLLGTCMHWISNDAFLFLDKDNCACIWERGAVKKLRYQPTGWFSYCAISPLETATALGHGIRKPGTTVLGPWIKDPTMAGAKEVPLERVGYLAITCTVGSNALSIGIEDIYPYQKTLERSIVQGADFKELGDLSECQWYKPSQKEGYPNPYIRPGQMLLLREPGKDKVTLIKPITLENGQMSYEWESRIVNPSSLQAAKPFTPKKDKKDAEMAQRIADKTPVGRIKMAPLKISTRARFSVSVVPGFRWDLPSDKTQNPYLLMPDPNEMGNQEEKLGSLQLVWKSNLCIEDIDDPSLPFSSATAQIEPYAANAIAKKQVAPGGVLLFRYSKLEGKYFAIEFVKMESDYIFYKTKTWHNVPGTERVAVAGQQP